MNKQAENCCRILTKEYLGEIKFKNLFQKFDKLIIYNHPKISSKKKILQYIIKSIILYREIIEIKEENQYSKILRKNEIKKGLKNYVVFTPCSAEKSKDLSIEYIIKIISILKKNNTNVIMLSDKTIKIENYSNLINLTGKTDLKLFIDYIKNSSLLITVDSAAFHIAEYLNIKSFLILSSRIIENYWIQTSNKNYYKNDSIDCKGCNMSICKFGNTKCINNENMINEVEKYLLNFLEKDN